MSSYVLYIPGAQGANPEHLERVGLAGLLRDGAPEFADCFDNCPDGTRGIIAAWRTGDAESDPPFDPRAFTWVPAKADTERYQRAGRFWFGTVADKPVKPSDIARREGISGYPITLADGQIWRIPAAVHLPHKHGLDDSGKFSRQVAEEYRDFWQASERYAIEFFKALDQLDLLRAARKVPIDAEDSVSFTLEDAWSYCCQALAVNYRVTQEIVDFLGLFDDTAMRNTIKATIELTSILEVRDQKKTEDLSIAVG